MINDSIPGDHTICHENSNVLSSKSKLDNTCTLTAIVKSNNSFIRSSYDHQYMKVILLVNNLLLFHSCEINIL